MPEMPEIVHSGGLLQHANSTRKLLSADDTHTMGLCPGDIVKRSTYGYIGIVGDTDLTMDFIVGTLYDENGVALPFQYLSADELNASNYYFDATPIGGLVLRIQEDALVTPIPVADEYKYVDITVTDATNITALRNVNPIGNGIKTYRIDSDSVHAASTNKSFKLLGAESGTYSATAGASPRVFLCKPITASESL